MSKLTIDSIATLDGKISASLKRVLPTAWVNFDNSVTPLVILDSYNVAEVVRISTGLFEIVFSTPMDNANYVVVSSTNHFDTGVSRATTSNYIDVNKAHLGTFISSSGGVEDNPINSAVVFGGID